MKTTNILEEVTNLDGGLKDGQTDHQLQGTTMVGAENTNHPVETGDHHNLLVRGASRVVKEQPTRPPPTPLGWSEV